jgi:hypothetical protein
MKKIYKRPLTKIINVQSTAILADSGPGADTLTPIVGNDVDREIDTEDYEETDWDY